MVTKQLFDTKIGVLFDRFGKKNGVDLAPDYYRALSRLSDDQFIQAYETAFDNNTYMPTPKELSEYSGAYLTADEFMQYMLVLSLFVNAVPKADVEQRRRHRQYLESKGLILREVELFLKPRPSNFLSDLVEFDSYRIGTITKQFVEHYQTIAISQRSLRPHWLDGLQQQLTQIHDVFEKQKKENSIPVNPNAQALMRAYTAYQSGNEQLGDRIARGEFFQSNKAKALMYQLKQAKQGQKWADTKKQFGVEFKPLNQRYSSPNIRSKSNVLQGNFRSSNGNNK